MNRALDTRLNVITFRIWNYPIFAILLGYVWLEMINPLLGYSLQIIPKIPNSAIALILCYIFRPNFIRQIRVPFNPVKWTLPFLIIVTINLPFIQYAQYRSIVELISTWFWILFLLPLMVRVLATQSGRWHFVLSSTVGLLALILQYYLVFFIFQTSSQGLELSYHHISASVIFLFPVLLGYIYLKKGLPKFFLILALTIVMFIAIPAGARVMWLILPIELILMALFVLPKSRFMASGVVVATGLFISLSFWDISDIYSDFVFDQLEIRKRKAIEWKEDRTVWKRLAMVKKTKMILNERPLLGVGYSNRSFSSFDGGDVEFMGHEARVRKYDAHNTYLNILGGTGILGLLAFLYYMRKVFLVFRKIPISSWLRLNHGLFIVAIAGVFLDYLFSTNPFSRIVHTTAIIFALYVYQYNLQISNTLLPENNR